MTATLRALSFAALGVLATAAATAAEWHVGPGQPNTSLRAAIAAAAAGDIVTVHGGVYQEGNLRIEKPLTLIGVANPVIDGGRTAEILTITGSRVTVRGFLVRNGGFSSLDDLAGIKVLGASEVTIDGNELRDCTFAIHLSKAKDCTVSGNRITGSRGNEQNSGNGIHLWSCERITVTGNEVRQHRDGIYLEFTNDSRMEGNVVEDNLRYGLHFMFSHHDTYHRNRFERNGAGVAVMYSREVAMTSNVFRHNWGCAAHGLLLKEMSDATIADNSFDHNTSGISMDGSNRMVVERNRFSENGWAVRVQTSCSDSTFRNNDFSGNSFDIQADGQLDNARFEHNYWDKYDGYDLNHDGTGDVPYRPVSLYAVVVGRLPSSILLLRSPIVQLLDQAEKAFPVITPERVADHAPAMRPHPATGDPAP